MALGKAVCVGQLRFHYAAPAPAPAPDSDTAAAATYRAELEAPGPCAQLYTHCLRQDEHQVKCILPL